MSDSDSLVRIEWHEQKPWVSVQNNWRDHLSPMDLATRVVAEHGKVVGPRRHRHRPPAPKGKLDYEDRKELRALRHEYVVACTEQRIMGKNTMSVETSRVTGIEAKWRSGALSILEFDLDWLDRSSAQSLSDALTELLSNPPEAPAHESPAVAAAIRNLERFGAKHD